MSSRVCAVALAAALAAVIAGCGGQPAAPAPSPSAATPSSSAKPQVDRVELGFADGKVAGGVQRLPIRLGSTVELVVTSDVADEVHLHGYDRKANVPAGGTVTISFVADVPGVFEVELENRKAQLAQLEVR